MCGLHEECDTSIVWSHSLSLFVPTCHQSYPPSFLQYKVQMPPTKKTVASWYCYEGSFDLTGSLSQWPPLHPQVYIAHFYIARKAI